MSDRDPQAQRPPSDVGGTNTQPAPNISTEHQDKGDARDPGDTLDSHDPKSDRDDDRANTPGGNNQEPPEKRPNVGIVEPDDYPQQQ